MQVAAFKLAGLDPTKSIPNYEQRKLQNEAYRKSLGLTNQLTKVISNNMHVNIQSISLSTEAGIFEGQVTVIVQNNTILKKLILNIKKIEGVDKVIRIYTS